MYGIRGETGKESAVEDERHELVSQVLPWVLIIAVATVELIRDHTDVRMIGVGSLATPAPALAAIGGRPRTVLMVSVAAVAVTAYVAIDRHLTAVGAVLLVSATSVYASVVRRRGAARLSQVQRVAETAQLALLRRMPRRVGELRLAARYVAAETEARIGGDLYEAVVRPRDTRLIIGDVRGKGLPAIRTSAAVLGAFREAAQYEPTLSRIATRCSEAVARLDEGAGEESDGQRETGGREAYGEGEADPEGAEHFVTAVVVEIEGPVLRMVNLGHPPPLLLTADGTRFVQVPEPVPPLGLAHQHFDDFPVRVQAWQPGDRLLLYTDGIEEARDADGRFFPLVRRVDALRDEPTPALPDALLGAVSEHAGGRLRDDAAIVVVEWSPDGVHEP
ncbi:serine/threonine-protein phosphatase [Streptomyces armeniacus]|uniref:Serine/threonine-protein phosphatase n=1 Tax=Streptomyces armeniacus TaxID=83291 RepID=A0A345XJG7_9ACTN|nr:PP2C family protein-serine/threonine phosphatase [Streptomyces armeniacus]AXK31783.1 serine/threonine-protein phosphatase [Streptomyces armeniacus]